LTACPYRTSSAEWSYCLVFRALGQQMVRADRMAVARRRRFKSRDCTRLLLCKLHKTPYCKPPKWTAYQTARPRATQAAACLAVRSATYTDGEPQGGRGERLTAPSLQKGETVDGWTVFGYPHPVARVSEGLSPQPSPGYVSAHMRTLWLHSSFMGPLFSPTACRFLVQVVRFLVRFLVSRRVPD